MPYAPGGATDVISRLVCQRLSQRLGRNFIVENKPGAGSNVGTEAVINSPADGYTLAADQHRQRHQRVVRPVAALRFRQGDRAGRRPRAHSAGDGDQQRPAGRDRGRVRRLRQGASRQAERRLVRRRHLAASVGRAVQGDDRRRLRPRPLPRIRTGAGRPDVRPGAAHVRQRHVVGRVRPRRERSARSA